MANRNSLIVLLIILNEFYNISANKDYKYVFVLFRHGARAPFLEKDYFNNEWEPERLTNVGKRMQYIAGLNDRERYKDLIPTIYNSNDIFARSTDTNRTIESLEARLQGLYSQELQTGPCIKDNQNVDHLLYPSIKPSDNIRNIVKEIGNSSLPHQTTIAIQHVLYNNQRLDLFNNEKACPGYVGYEKQENVSKEGIKNMIEFLNSKNSFDINSKSYITNRDILLDKFNIDILETNINENNKLFLFCDNFITNFYNSTNISYILPKNKYNHENLYKDSIKFLKNDLFNFKFGSANNYFSSRLESGYKWRDILYKIKNRIVLNKNPQTRDAYFYYKAPRLEYYSGHDTSVAALLGSLASGFKFDIPDDLNIEFASDVRVELYQNELYEYNIDIVYNNFNLLTVDYYTFEKQVVNKIDMTYDDAKKFCKWEDNNYKNDYNYLIWSKVALITSITTIVLLIILLVSMFAIDNKKQYIFF